eukprot:scaffold2402_cov132-Skeletonema_dohrnii-CCMP3373.AAC.8
MPGPACLKDLLVISDNHCIHHLCVSRKDQHKCFKPSEVKPPGSVLRAQAAGLDADVDAHRRQCEEIMLYFNKQHSMQAEPFMHSASECPSHDGKWV